jgi:hypothetical protein
MEQIDFILEAALAYLMPRKAHLTYAAARGVYSVLLVKALPGTTATRQTLKDIAMTILTTERFVLRARLETSIRRLERSARNAEARAEYYMTLYRQTALLVPDRPLTTILQNADGFMEEADSEPDSEPE